MADVQEDEAPLPSFRPTKRRKVYRKRPGEEGKDDEALRDSVTATSPPAESLDDLIAAASASTEPDAQSSLSDLLRQRKALQRKRHGIEFSATRSNSTQTPAESMEISRLDAEKEATLNQIDSRFATQTAQAVAEDKHMMAYIESQLSSRLDPSQAKSEPPSSTHDSTTTTSIAPPPQHSTYHQHPSRQPATLGKLLEIDLDAHNSSNSNNGSSKNGDRAGAGAGTPPNKKPPRVRLGRDGRPLPPRAPKRRSSSELRRDKLVEDLLRENRLEMYDTSAMMGGSGSAAARGAVGQSGGDGGGGGGGGNGAAGSAGAVAPGMDLAADETLAAQFKQEFLDAMQARRQPAQPASSASSSAAGKQKAGGALAKEEERLKGPKLGGSRSQRAVLRERELEAQRERERKGR